LLVGTLALVGVLFMMKGLLYVADTRDAMGDDAIERPGHALVETFYAADGWSETDLLEAREDAADSGASSVVILHQGRLVAEWGRSHELSDLGAARASVMSLMWGVARAQGVLPGDSPRPHLNLDTVAADRADSLAGELETRTGLALGELVDAWLAQPLGMVDFDPTHVIRQSDPQRAVDRHVLRMSARDLARLGQLVLDHGQAADGQSVVPADWVEESTGPLHPRGNFSSGYRGDGWWVPSSGQVEARGRGGLRVRIDRQLDLVVVVGVLSGDDATERAVWTMLGDRQQGGEFRHFLQRVKTAGRLGRIDGDFDDLVDDGEVEAAVNYARAVRAREPGTFLYTEAQLNRLGYQLLGDDQTADAILIFKLSVEEFPRFFNTHDSLGEAYYEAGDHERARACYQRALELHPESESARRMLERLSDDG